MSLKDIKTKLAEFVQLSEGDEEYGKFAKDFAKDVSNHEAATELMKNEFYASVVKDMEDGNAKTKDALMLANLERTSNDTIRMVLADYQATNRTVNTLKGRELSVIEAQLDRAIKTIKEAKEEEKASA